jgi:hypothetical protein
MKLKYISDKNEIKTHIYYMFIPCYASDPCTEEIQHTAPTLTPTKATAISLDVFPQNSSYITKYARVSKQALRVPGAAPS